VPLRALALTAVAEEQDLEDGAVVVDRTHQMKQLQSYLEDRAS
jgi:hypothetical protein